MMVLAGFIFGAALSAVAIYVKDLLSDDLDGWGVARAVRAFDRRRGR